MVEMYCKNCNAKLNKGKYFCKQSCYREYEKTNTRTSRLSNGQKTPSHKRKGLSTTEEGTRVIW
jgi:hypothetical protein